MKAKEKHATHTPGPWGYTLADETSRGGVYGNEKCVCDITPKDLQVGKLTYDCEKVEIANANARLIAAAPELFETMKAILAVVNDAGPILGTAIGDKLREILAKVEGGEG